MKRLLGIGLNLLALAFIAVVLLDVWALIVARNWAALGLFGIICLLFIRAAQLVRENKRLKQRIGELEMGLGL